MNVWFRDHIQQLAQSGGFDMLLDLGSGDWIGLDQSGDFLG